MILLASALLLVLLLAPEARAALTNVYVAQSVTGSGDGSSCANAKAVTFFNTPGNWGSGSTQIGPATTVHLCGTITTQLTVLGSGSVGNPVTVLWERDAKISHATCSPTCINMNGKSYITLDGGTNGIIEATANGTLLPNQLGSKGVDCQPCPNAEIRHLTIKNMYVVSMPDGKSFGTSVYLYSTSNSNISIHHNTFDNGFRGVNWALNGRETNNTIFANTFRNQGWPIVYGTGNGGVNADGITIHDNDITNGSNWCGPTPTGDHHHLDPIHLWAVQASTAITGVKIYNNYIHGDFCTGNTTGAIYVESFAGNNVASQIFNNLIVFDAGQTTDGAISTSGRGGTISTQILNNTIDCGPVSGGGGGIYLQGSIYVDVKAQNNIILNCWTPIYMEIVSPNPISVIDYNNYYPRVGSKNRFVWGGAFTDSFATWKTNCGCDSHSIATSPLLSANYTPPSGSPVVGAGAILTSLNITALLEDKAGVPRSPNDAWDIGCFAQSTKRPKGPTGLSVR
jgi:hypothetical protein